MELVAKLFKNSRNNEAKCPLAYAIVNYHGAVYLSSGDTLDRNDEAC